MHATYQRGDLGEVWRACFMAERDRKGLFAASTDGLDYRNLAADPGHREEMERLKGALDAWRESTGDFDYRPYEPPKQMGSGAVLVPTGSASPPWPAISPTRR